MSIKEVQAKLQQAEQNAEHFRALADNPNLSFRAALAAHNSYRSYRAAAKLYRKALDYELAKAQAAFEATMKQSRSTRMPPATPSSTAKTPAYWPLSASEQDESDTSIDAFLKKRGITLLES